MFQYEVSIEPDVMHENYIMHGIFRTIKKQADRLLGGNYVLSGRTIFTTVDLTDSILIDADFQSVKYKVLISADNKKFFSGK